MRTRLALAGVTLVLTGPQPAAGQIMTVKDLLALPQPAADHRLAYGAGPQQFGELRLPEGYGPFPVVVTIHGGCWLAPYDLGHLAGLAAALTDAGVATWSLEYRRVGDPGGGYPGTFLDAAAGFEHLRALAGRFPLDLSRVVVLGHSAGGHLALWLAGRQRIPASAPLHGPVTVRPVGVVALAPIGDLVAGAARRVCGDAIARLLGGEPTDVPERVVVASPAALLPLGIPQQVILGEADVVVPGDLGKAWVEDARAAGDGAELVTVPAAGHYELVTPGSVAWPAVREAVFALLEKQTPGS